MIDGMQEDNCLLPGLPLSMFGRCARKEERRQTHTNTTNNNQQTKVLSCLRVPPFLAALHEYWL
eukprot:5960565-Lingulodinium_polyedra.AAC.1